MTDRQIPVKKSSYKLTVGNDKRRARKGEISVDLISPTLKRLCISGNQIPASETMKLIGSSAKEDWEREILLLMELLISRRKLIYFRWS